MKPLKNVETQKEREKWEGRPTFCFEKSQHNKIKSPKQSAAMEPEVKMKVGKGGEGE